MARNRPQRDVPDFATALDTSGKLSFSLRQVDESIEAMNAGLDRQRRILADINVLSAAPAALKERVRLTIEQETAQKALNKALADERAKQQPASLLNKLTFGALGKPAGKAPEEEGEGKGSIAGGLGNLAGIAGQAAIGLAAFQAVALASPGTIERFNLALGDTTAVVGQTLVPVFDVLTDVVKLVGDVLASIMPSAGDMKAALEPVTTFLQDLREALQPVAPIVRDVLVVGLRALGVAINIVLLPFRILAKLITALFGGPGDPMKSSTGAAARNLTFTSPEAAAKSVYAAAFKGSAGAVKEPEYTGALKTIINVLESINAVVRSIADKVGAIVEAPKGVADAVKGMSENVVDKLPAALRAKIEERVKRRRIFEEAAEGVVRRPGAESLDEFERARKAYADWLDQSKRRAMDRHPGGA